MPADRDPVHTPRSLLPIRATADPVEAGHRELKLQQQQLAEALATIQHNTEAQGAARSTSQTKTRPATTWSSSRTEFQSGAHMSRCDCTNAYDARKGDKHKDKPGDNQKEKPGDKPKDKPGDKEKPGEKELPGARALLTFTGFKRTSQPPEKLFYEIH